MWDYDAQSTVPYYFQAFIGHSYPVRKCIFNPHDNRVCYSVGSNGGLFVWSFDGNVEANFNAREDAALPVATQIDRNALHEPTVLEKMRMSVKEKKQPKLAEGSFIIPPFE